jgi:hypothetical protein
MGHPPTPSSPSSLLSLGLPPINSALLLRGTTERNRSSQLRRIEGTCSCSRAWLRGDVLPISFSVRFLIPALLRAVGPPTSPFQDLLASLAKVASDGGEINRSPQSCIHLNCRLMCTLPEAPHRFVDSSGLRQATCGRGWSTASTTLSGTGPSVLCRLLTPYPKSFLLVLPNAKTQACAFFLMCPRSGKLLPESGICLPKPGFSELQQPSIENPCTFTSPATSKRDPCRLQKLAVAEGKEIQQHWMVLSDATKVLRWWSCRLPCSFPQLPHTHTHTHTPAQEIFSRSYNVLSAASHVLISVALGPMRLPTAQLCGSSQLLWYEQMSTMQWTVPH